MKLTPELLYKLGFRGEDKDITNNPAYRFEVPYNPELNRWYHYQIQIVLGDYPDTNGNSGVFSLYDPEVKDAHMTMQESEEEKADLILWDNEDGRGGIKYITIEERVLHIAWHVTTLERLNQIYTALTGNPPLAIKEKIN